jgi:hypothetical protein
MEHQPKITAKNIEQFERMQQAFLALPEQVAKDIELMEVGVCGWHCYI